MRLTLNKSWRSFKAGQTINGLHKAVYDQLIADGIGFNPDLARLDNPSDEPEKVKAGKPPGSGNKMMTREKAPALKGGLDP